MIFCFYSFYFCLLLSTFFNCLQFEEPSIYIERDSISHLKEIQFSIEDFFDTPVPPLRKRGDRGAKKTPVAKLKREKQPSCCKQEKKYG